MPASLLIGKDKALIYSYFAALEQTIFSLENLEEILQVDAPRCQFPFFATREKFANSLVASDILVGTRFKFENNKSIIRYWKKSTDILDIVLSFFNNAYLSHASAISIHKLTDKKSGIVCATIEQGKKLSRSCTAELIQEDVDDAFQKPQRKTTYKCRFRGQDIIVHNGMFTDKAGVATGGGRRFTSIERTLIDVMVRPAYCGGVHNVLSAFKKAKSLVNLEELIALLDKLDYTYPYFQSIGFYLEQAGYSSPIIEELKAREKLIDFYLDYDMKEMSYSEEWRLFYPKQFRTRS